MLPEKLQIVHINEKDAKDVIVLLREHEIGSSDKETINVHYIAKILAGDWGFYSTATTNIKKLENHLKNYSTLIENDESVIKSK